MYKKIFEKMKLPIAIFQKDGIYIHKNEEYEKLYSYSENIYMDISEDHQYGIHILEKILENLEKKKEYILKIESLFKFKKTYIQICEFYYFQDENVFVIIIQIKN